MNPPNMTPHATIGPSGQTQPPRQTTQQPQQKSKFPPQPDLTTAIPLQTFLQRFAIGKENSPMTPETTPPVVQTQQSAEKPASAAPTRQLALPPPDRDHGAVIAIRLPIDMAALATILLAATEAHGRHCQVETSENWMVIKTEGGA